MKHSASFAPSLALASALGLALLTPLPAQAQSSDDIIRTLVQLADVVFRDGQPYYRYGSNERLVVGRDQYGRSVYYRVNDYGNSNYGQTVVGRDAYGRTIYYQNQDYGSYPYQERYPYQGGASYQESNSTTRCNTSGWCTRTYYDPRYDRTRSGRHPY